MSEHGWPDGHDDDGHGYGDEYAAGPSLPGGADDLVAPLDEPVEFWQLHDDDGLDPVPAPAADDVPVSDEPPQPHADPVAVHDTPGLGPVGADPDAVAGPGDDDGPVFPSPVDVGALPEPVDGFPWIDTSSLGLAAAGPLPVPDEPVQPQELAAYAAQDLPPGVDPWAELAGSDDPATAALARWWAEHQPDGR